MERLPIEIVKHIISYDKRFIIRHGKIIQINQIDKNDKRRDLLVGIKKINYNANDNSSYVYLNINSHKSFYIMYFDSNLELFTLCCDEKGNEEILE
uniref:Uncharacterized protein n=1 Tax=viral metagenome TaxID=1070528 RepID=A0A6C0DAB4_9ZZZZ